MSYVLFSSQAACSAEIEAENRAVIARHTRLLALAEQNGFISEIVEQPWQKNLRWWVVPREFVPIVGCMMAAVA